MAVMSVSGPLDNSSLGIISPHEHIFIDMSVFFTPSKDPYLSSIEQKPISIEHLGLLKRNASVIKDNVMMLDVQTQTKEMLFFHRAGGRTVVDATTVGLGRDVTLLKQMADTTGLNIIAGAGFYVEGAQSEKTKKLSVEQIEDHIIKELTEGIDNTSIKAGIIGEVGISHRMLSFEEKNLRGSARAQRRTNAPLLIHINPFSTEGLKVLTVLQEEKVNLSRVVMCHVDGDMNEEYIISLLKSGVYIEFDNFGKEMYLDRWDMQEGTGRFVTDLQRVKLIKKLIDLGYVNQILLACDVCLKTLLHSYGGWGYDHLLAHIVPMLQEEGLSDNSITQMLKINPRNWLTY